MKHLDRYRGCLLGGAAGDALGYPVEFLSLTDIQEQYGPAGITSYTLQNGVAQISDDTQMTLFTANGLLFSETRQRIGAPGGGSVAGAAAHDPHYEYMAKHGCRIGGEQSGHIIFSKYATTGDGILTSLKMMEVMLARKKKLSELAAPLKIYPQVLENVRVADKKAAMGDPAVQAAVEQAAAALGDSGRILVRESGTEPVIRVMVEAPDKATCQQYVNAVVNVIHSKGYGIA